MDEAGRGTTEYPTQTKGKGKEPQEAGRTHASSSLRRANSFSAWFFFVVLFFFFIILAAHRCACEAKSQFQFHIGVLSGAKKSGGGTEKTVGFPEKCPILMRTRRLTHTDMLDNITRRVLSMQRVCTTRVGPTSLLFKGTTETNVYYLG